MKALIIFTICNLIVTQQIISQGCVAIRSNGNTCSLAKPGDGKSWQFNANMRFFRSYRHYVGTEEQKHRVDTGTEVINYTASLDLTITRSFNQYWSLAVTLPVISNVRSSLYEHGGNSPYNPANRHKTKSFGMGDMRITAYRWLFNPQKSTRGNLQAGLGLKLPTGNYEVMDFFVKNDGSRVLGPVDQSIQLGDGGTGFTTELNGFYRFSTNLSGYGNVYYLINPMEQNGVSTKRGGIPNQNDLLYHTSTMSVPDQFMARLGVNYMFHKVNASLGGRIEGIPSSDLIGGDKGFRRPGYVISAEPVLSFQGKKTDFYLSVPVALVRNRTQSNSDKLRTEATGVKVQGDAAFADYSVNVGVSFRF